MNMDRRDFVRQSTAFAAASAFLPACAKDNSEKGNANMKVKVTKDKVLVVYFSRSGNTRHAAETFAKACGGARLVEIKAAKPYAPDYGACCDEAKPECYGKTLCPIKPIEGLDLAKYDLVFVGSPNWWGTMAPPVRTWVSQSKDALKGKKVCLFQTHGGGGMQRVGKEFAETVGDTATVLSPKAFSGSSIKSNVKVLEDFADERIAGK